MKAKRWTATTDVIKSRMWLAGYELEEARQLYSSGGCLWKEAITCVVLALLRTVRVI